MQLTPLSTKKKKKIQVKRQVTFIATKKKQEIKVSPTNN